MKQFYLLILIVISQYVISQDKIHFIEGDSIEVKVLEINETEIKYKKFSNLEGPLYTVDKSSVYEIYFSNGEVEKLNKNITDIDNQYLELESSNIDVIFSRGKKVFVDNPNLAKPKAIMYLREHLEQWGYWEVTENIYEADFIIDYYFSKKAMADKSAKVILKTRNGIIYKESREYYAKGRHNHGFNPSSWVANKIVEQYLKVEFK
ncbi:hypothetical protein [Moheibacter lacus]|uniref:Uncharacterized protein n=1 Tax=Moheibacter lacus TaxID=2745851 RepID=A0A838ZQP4_9FLAO|nr:hypothetical protein [Moheibacter lacus]MBA5629605.1 hypothetical protein [Moheibacter lacus]